LKNGYVGEKNYGYSIITGESRDIDKACRVIKEYIFNNKEVILDANKLKSIREKLTVNFLSGFSSVQNVGNNFVSYYMRNINILDYIDVINEINCQDIIDRIKVHISDKNMALSVIRAQ